MTNARPLSIPVILGTTRKERMSVHVARFVAGEVATHDGVETELIDIAQLSVPMDDEGGGDQDAGFAAKMNHADALVIVTPEYNHSFPGLLKHVLDSNRTEYVHKAVGIAGVSGGSFGGTRVIENFLPVLRALGLTTIFRDLNFGSVGKAFDEAGHLLEQAYVRRTHQFLKELIWMAETLRHGREHIQPRA